MGTVHVQYQVGTDFDLKMKFVRVKCNYQMNHSELVQLDDTSVV